MTTFSMTIITIATISIAKRFVEFHRNQSSIESKLNFSCNKFTLHKKSTTSDCWKAKCFLCVTNVAFCHDQVIGEKTGSKMAYLQYVNVGP